MAKGYGFEVGDAVIVGAIALLGYFGYKAVVKPVSDVTGAVSGLAENLIDRASNGVSSGLFDSPYFLWGSSAIYEGVKDLYNEFQQSTRAGLNLTGSGIGNSIILPPGEHRLITGRPAFDNQLTTGGRSLIELGQL